MFLGKHLLYSAQKTSGSVKGSEGVLAYFIPDIQQTLAVMYSVPFNSVYNNWFGIRLVGSQQRADEDLWEVMYNEKTAFKGDDTWHHRKLGSGLRMRGAMSSANSQATIEIAVTSEAIKSG